jgi:hypothetical protein
LSFLAGEADSSSVRFDDFAGKRESKPDARHTAIKRISAEKFREHSRLVLVPNTRPLVADGGPHDSVVSGTTDGDAAADGRVLRCVREQVAHDLSETAGISDHEQPFCGHIDDKVVRTRIRSSQLRLFSENRRKIEPCQVSATRALSSSPELRKSSTRR